MNDAIERPSPRLSFQLLVAIALGLALVAFIAGREIYVRYGGYRPLALVHVPSDMRYRARVELGDPKRAPALAPLFSALDPRGTRLLELERRLGVKGSDVVRELAFGVGPKPADFVVVFGLQLQAQAGLPTAKVVCEVLHDEGIPSELTTTGCRLRDGMLLGATPAGALLIASRESLVKDLLNRPEMGDRLGFSGPSVRGAAPDPADVAREAAALAQLVATKYP